MCLISVAWRCSANYPFVFAGNRDEYHSRASAPAQWWSDTPEVLGGRDLVAGGSWLGINTAGRFAVVTNRPDLPAPETGALSRGALVIERLLTGANDHNLDQQLQLNSQNYGGFSLLTGNVAPGPAAALQCHSGGNGLADIDSKVVQPGVFGLSNTDVAEPWPKLTWLNAELTGLAAANQVGNIDKLFSLLLREDPVPGADSDWVSARPFIVGPTYGTRCATIITIDRAGECRFIERRFGPGGTATGTTDRSFALSTN